MFRILNANASMGVSLALSGHRFRVIALDGNPVPVQASVEVLKLDVAERADVIVEMNNPGVWVLGSTDDDDRKMGLGIVVEYENQRGEPQWVRPETNDWRYTAFARTAVAQKPDETIAAETRENPRRTRRLQSLDHQRQVMAGHQAPAHRPGGPTLSARHGEP